MVTARSEEIDRIVGFELGADDYVTKPFSVRELLLRVKAILRRDRASTNGPAPATGILKSGDITVDLERHRVEVSTREVTLTALEFRLLTCLMERAGRVQTRDVLLSDVWGLDSEVETRTVDAHVKRLRRKLGAAGDAVETVRGVGYRLREAI
jgi:two-component system phosphate regulon response regulator PhoB